MIGTDLWNIFSSYGLTVIPMFILVGEFAHYGGYNDGLYNATYKWFGHYKGGLAITTIMACAIFSAISGSNTATAATMSTVAIPEMRKYNYHPQLNAGSVAAGATLGFSYLQASCLSCTGSIHRPIHRKALFRQCYTKRHTYRSHCSDSILYLLASSGLGPKGTEKHLDGTV